jgi:tellurite resistance protein TehA-like permease
VAYPKHTKRAPFRGRKKRRKRTGKKKKKFTVQVLTIFHMIIFILFRAGWTLKLVSYKVNLSTHVSHNQLKGGAGQGGLQFELFQVIGENTTAIATLFVFCYYDVVIPSVRYP